MLEPGRFTSSRFGGRTAGGGGPSIPYVALILSPQSPVSEDAPVGTVVAMIATDATTLTLGGPDMGILQISDGEVVTTGALTGRSALSFSVIGSRDGYGSRTRSATIEVDEVQVDPDPEVAPAVKTAPSISGSTTVGSILTRTAGTATGIPAPTRTTAWLRNGNVISGQTGNTLDTSDFAVGDVITTRDVWTNTIGGVVRTATGTSPEWTLTAQPTLTATVSTLTAGQQATVTFNEAPDSVSVIQGGTALTATRVGTTKAWTFTPATDAPVTIGATLAGYTAYSATLDVQPAPPALVITSANTGRITGVDAASPPVDFQIIQPARYAGTRTVTPSQMAAGPVAHVAPTQSGTGAVGQLLTGDPGLWLTLADDCDLAYRWTRRTTANAGETPVVIAGATGTTYTLTSADQGQTVRFEVVASDQHGERTATATGTAVPAVDTGVFPTFKPSATTSQKGKITPQPNGDLLIEWDAAANTNPRVYCDVTPGQAYELRTELEFGGATRIIGRLADAGGSTGTDFFDITKTAGQTTLSRTDTFTPAAGRVAMHYIFVMPNGATAKILATTRLRSL